MKTDAKTNTEESAEEIRPTEAAADAAETTTANAPETTAAEVPTDANGDPIMWDEEHPDRLDFDYYPGVKSVFNCLTTIRAITVILPLSVIALAFLWLTACTRGSYSYMPSGLGLTVMLYLATVILATVIAMGILTTMSRWAVRSGSNNAIFLTRASCYCAAINAACSIFQFLSYDFTSAGMKIGAVLQLVVLGAAIYAIYKTHADGDIQDVFPPSRRSASLGDWILVLITVGLPLTMTVAGIMSY